MSGAAVAETLDDLLRPLEQSPISAAAHARAAGNRAAAHADASLPNPAIAADTTMLPGVENEVELTLTQSFPLARRGVAYRALADATEAAALADGDVSLAARRSEVADAFYDALYRQARLEVLREHEVAVDRATTALQRRVDAGDAAPFEHGRMAAELRRVQRSRAVEQTHLSRGLQRLGELAFTAAPASVEGTLQPPSCAPQSPTAPPHARALDAHRAVAVARARATRADRAPQLQLGAGWITVGDAPRFGEHHGVVAGVQLELPFWSRARAASDALEADATALEIEHTTALRRAEFEVAAATRACESFAQLATEATQSVADAQQLLNSVEAGYQAGELSLLELLDTQGALTEERLAALELQHAARRASNDVGRWTGGW